MRLSALLLIALLSACTTNPVTGEKELTLVSESQELAMGARSFVPVQQMQGGRYGTDAELTEYVQSVGQRVAAQSDRELDYEFVVINNPTPNAWALPGGKIGVNIGLLWSLDDEAELAAVLGHEVVHAAARHTAQAQTRGMLLQGALLATSIAARDHDYSNYVVGGARVAAGLLNQKYSRDAEREADLYGIEYMTRAGYDPQGAVELQETFVELSKAKRQDWLSGLLASHPASEERLEANRRAVASLGVDGERGAERYRRATAELREVKPAYEKMDKARAELRKGRLGPAREHALEAVAIAPEQGHFRSLLGDVAFASRDYDEAVEHYSDALELNPDYFRYYLGRGESLRRLGREEAARADLQASIELLPTADALLSLGILEQGARRYDRAVQFYEAAAASNTPAGRASVERLVELDLPRRPQRYVTIQRGIDQSGRVYLELQNRTPVPLTAIEYALAWRDTNGRMRQERRRYGRTVGAGKSVIVMLGPKYAPVYRTLQAQVISGRAVRSRN